MSTLKTTAALLLCAALLMPAGLARADEVADLIQRGLKLYQDGKLSQAMEELNFALAQMRQKKAEALVATFPEPPAGWVADKPSSESAGAGFLGGGVRASQTYRQKNGQGRATIEMITDSPLIQSMATLLSNPMFLQGGAQGKLVRVNGQKGLLKERSPKQASLQILVDKQILLTIKVRRFEGAAGLAKELAGKIDLAKLRELVQ